MKMKKVVLFVTLVFSLNFGFTQDGDLGPFIGAAFYVGEINQSKAFYMPSLVYGAIYKHNFAERFSLRIEGSHTKLKGNDANSDFLYQNQRNFSFTNNVTDLSAGIEFNFLPFDKSEKNTKYFTPYIFTGLSFLVIPENVKSFTFSIPFCFGMKYAISEKITLGAEWSIRKTFTDYLDKIDEDKISNLRTLQQNKQLSYNLNNDWFSYAGIILSFQIFADENQCPAYN